MEKSVFKTEAGREAIQSAYEEILASYGRQTMSRGQGARDLPALRRQTVATALGPTHVIEAGSAGANVLLCLHGTASNSATWLGEVPLWSRHFRVIAVDLPGEPGLSADRRMVLAQGETTAWLADVMDELGVDECGMVGMSLGGWVALHWALQNPGRVRALSLISASGLAPARRSFLFKALPLLLLGDWGLERINRMLYHRTEVPPPVHAFGKLVARHFRPLVEPIPVFGDQELLGLPMPIQYFGGTRDVLVRTMESGERLQRLLPHSQVHLLADTGHVVLGQGESVLRFQRRAVGEAT